MIPLRSVAFLCQAAMDAAEGSGNSAGALSFNRDASKRQQGMLRFSAHLALSLPALGLLPPPHDMTASLAFRDLQVSSTRMPTAEFNPAEMSAFM